MALLLLLLGLSLALAEEFNPQAVVQRNYNMARVSGRWHLISLASNNLTRIRENGDLRVFIRNIDLLKNGSLRFNFRFMLLGECVAVKVVCEEMERNGEYTIDYQGKNKVLVLETDYRSYIIFQLQNSRNGTQTYVLALFGRIPKLSHSYIDRFEKHCKNYGMGQENIMDMTSEDNCYSKR